MTTVAIYAEGGKGVGLGHVMRMSVLAGALLKKGCKIKYFFPNKARNPYIRQKGFHIVGLPDSGKFKILEKALAAEPVDLLVLDSYELAASVLVRLRRHASFSVVFDDNFRALRADAVVNTNAYAENQKVRYPRRIESLLGTKFLLLRDEFEAAQKKYVRKSVKNVLVMLGGAPLKNVLGDVLRALSTFTDVERVHVVCGPFFPTGQEKQRLPFEVRRYRSPSGEMLAQLMRSCDVAVSGGGQSLYELARSGVPTVGILLGRDQRRNLEALSERGACLVASGRGFALRRALESNLRQLLNPKERRAMSLKARKLVAGKGAERVASRLLEFLRRRRF